jgi:two-component system cell cycle sensor histidine kinase/response regulator CckA
VKNQEVNMIRLEKTIRQLVCRARNSSLFWKWLVSLGGGLSLLGLAVRTGVLQNLTAGLAGVNPIAAFALVVAAICCLCFWPPGKPEPVGTHPAPEEFELRVVERTAELNAAIQTLQDQIAAFQLRVREQAELLEQYESHVLRSQRMDCLGAVAGGIAHDLNNALAPVIMSVDLLKQRRSRKNRDRFLDVIASSAHRAAEMVKQIVSFARGAERQSEPLQLGYVVCEMIRIIQNTFPKSISIEAHVPARRLWKIRGDVTELHQVLLNLCVNARDAMPRGGKMTLSAENVTLDKDHLPSHSTNAPGAYVRLSVADTGTGIPPEVLGRMFEPFFTTKGPEKGTGLGLSTVASIVREHGGFIDVKTELGQGTEFRVYLPAVDVVDDVETTCPKADLPRGNGELILIIEDEEVVRELAKSTLENYGYEVITALNGLDGIARFEEHQQEIKLVIADTDMPSMDGLTAIGPMRRARPDLPVIVASGTKRDTVFFKRTDLNRLVNLDKPYTLEGLLTAVARLLSAQEHQAPKP